MHTCSWVNFYFSQMAIHSSALAWKIPWTGAWQATVHVAKSLTRQSDFTFTFHSHALEKEMATHSSVIDQRIPETEESWWATVYEVAQNRTRLK